jgi:hypothetical protein
VGLKEGEEGLRFSRFGGGNELDVDVVGRVGTVAEGSEGLAMARKSMGGEVVGWRVETVFAGGTKRLLTELLENKFCRFSASLKAARVSVRLSRVLGSLATGSLLS